MLNLIITTPTTTTPPTHLLLLLLLMLLLLLIMLLQLVPKKVMYNASHVNELLHEAKEFGFTVSEVSFNWSKLKAYRDRYISRLVEPIEE